MRLSELARWVVAALLVVKLVREAERAASGDWVERLGALMRLPLIAAAALVAVLVAVREPRE